MCGINCIISNSLSPELRTEYVSRMNSHLVSRGPDAMTVHSEKDVTLGHTLLNIRSTSEKARQPLLWLDYILVFNGEIYNISELKTMLKSTYHFYSESDGEILLYLFYEYGVRSFSFLNGEFSFLLWDKKTETLYAVVDHLAIKQLYYADTPHGFVFSSEIHSLFACPEVRQRLNYQSMYDVLTMGCCLNSQTMYQRVNIVEGGTYLAVKGGIINTNIYYQLPQRVDNIPNDKIEERIEEIHFLIKQAVSSRTVGKYGIASSLSGGVDSGLITILAMQDRPDIISLSGYFAESANPAQELYNRQFLSVLYGLLRKDFKETTINKKKLALFLKLQDDVAYHQSHFARIDLAAACVREKKRVLLVGDGADELLLGYVFYTQLGSILSGASSKRVIEKNRYFSIIRELIRNHYSPPYFSNHFFYTDKEKSVFFSKEHQSLLLYRTEQLISDELRDIHLFEKDALNLFSYAELKYKLRQITVFYDRLASHFSLEIRFPFLDKKLIDAVLPIPSEYKINNGQSKALLKKIYSRYVPKHIAYMRKSGMASDFSGCNLGALWP